VLVFLSSIMTLEPGDVVEVRISGTGTLKNPVKTG